MECDNGFWAKALATWVDPESPLAKTTRVYSYLGNPNLLAGYLLPAVVLSVVALVAWQGWIKKSPSINDVYCQYCYLNSYL